MVRALVFTSLYSHSSSSLPLPQTHTLYLRIECTCDFCIYHLISSPVYFYSALPHISPIFLLYGCPGSSSHCSFLPPSFFSFFLIIRRQLLSVDSSLASYPYISFFIFVYSLLLFLYNQSSNCHYLSISVLRLFSFFSIHLLSLPSLLSSHILLTYSSSILSFLFLFFFFSFFSFTEPKVNLSQVVLPIGHLDALLAQCSSYDAFRKYRTHAGLVRTCCVNKFIHIYRQIYMHIYIYMQMQLRTL